MALRRSAEALVAFDEAFTLYAALQDVDGIERTTIASGSSLGWGGHLEEACRVYDRGLVHLSPTAQRARIAIKAETIWPLTALSESEQARHVIEDIVAASSDLGDQKLVATVLSAKAGFERSTAQFQNQLQTSTHALALLPSDAYWLRADAGWTQAYAYYYNGRLADAQAAAVRTEADAQRAGHRRAVGPGARRRGDALDAKRQPRRCTRRVLDLVQRAVGLRDRVAHGDVHRLPRSHRRGVGR
jgi:hypothetical protein